MWEVPPPQTHPTLPRAKSNRSKGQRLGLAPGALLRGPFSPNLCLCLPRKPALSCTVCSNNLLSCCKSLWALRFLQRHVGGPSEEQPGEPLAEEPPKTPPQEAVRTLPSEAV